KKRKICFLVGRLGFGTTTFCNDCDDILTCTKCNRPIILHDKKGKDRIYICRHCGLQEKPTDRCPKCGSWRLTTLGIGTELVAKAVTQINNKIDISIIDSEHINTPKQATRAMTDFIDNKNSHILIGTEMILDYLVEPIDYIAVISLDHLLALPGFRFKEKLAHILVKLAEFTNKKLLIQTRLNDENIWQYINQGNLLDFCRQEIKDRQNAGWPPFSTLIKISRVGPELAVQKDMDRLENLLKPFSPIVYPSFVATPRGHLNLNLLIKIPPDNWPDEELSAVLKALPPTFLVNVEPADIL
ncbi:MAG: hypothetical protein QG665_186, partial [Patescibacteria group bacterium]|nr:hypothetical protein [Patescibacteria group bacterium]